MADAYPKGSKVKVDGNTYIIGVPVSAYTVTDQYGYETMLTVGQLKAGKRTIIPGDPVDMSMIDLDSMTASDKAKLKAALAEEAGLKKKPGGK